MCFVFTSIKTSKFIVFEAISVYWYLLLRACKVLGKFEYKLIGSCVKHNNKLNVHHIKIHYFAVYSDSPVWSWNSTVNKRLNWNRMWIFDIPGHCWGVGYPERHISWCICMPSWKSWEYISKQVKTKNLFPRFSTASYVSHRVGLRIIYTAKWRKPRV